MNTPSQSLDRTSWASTARAEGSREMAQRSWLPPSLLPEPTNRPGWVHRWIRTAVRGDADATTASKAFREGWEPCKLTEYPELKLDVHPRADGQQSGLVEVGGLLLCKMPAEMDAQRNKYYANLSRQQTQSVDAQVRQASDPRVPLTTDFRSKVEFGNRGDADEK